MELKVLQDIADKLNKNLAQLHEKGSDVKTAVAEFFGNIAARAGASNDKKRRLSTGTKLGLGGLSVIAALFAMGCAMPNQEPRNPSSSDNGKEDVSPPKGYEVCDCKDLSETTLWTAFAMKLSQFDAANNVQQDLVPGTPQHAGAVREEWHAGIKAFIFEELARQGVNAAQYNVVIYQNRSGQITHVNVEIVRMRGEHFDLQDPQFSTWNWVPEHITRFPHMDTSVMPPRAKETKDTFDMVSSGENGENRIRVSEFIKIVWDNGVGRTRTEAQGTTKLIDGDRAGYWPAAGIANLQRPQPDRDVLR